MRRADEILSAALDANADSYYLANLLAEVRLEDGRSEAAQDAFRRALQIIAGLQETNEWVHATAANAAFFLGDQETAARHLRAIRDADVDAGTRATIERGLRAISARVEDGAARLETLLGELSR